MFGSRKSAFLSLLVLLSQVLFLSSLVSAAPDVEFLGSQYDPTSDSSTFQYRVSLADTEQFPVINFVVGLRSCRPALDVLSWTPNNRWSQDPNDDRRDGPQKDPHTGLFGVVWLVWITPGQSQEFSVTFRGNVEEGVVSYSLQQDYCDGASGAIVGARCETDCPEGTRRIVLDWEGFAAGTIVDNEFLPKVSVSAVNGCSTKPDIATIFDSSCPSSVCSGDDQDLGTPSAIFGGPGVGTNDSPGLNNDSSQSSLLIIAENDIDRNEDGLLDDPDDSKCGGMLNLVFDNPNTQVQSVRIIDVDEQGGTIQTFSDEIGGTEVSSVNIDYLGDNSARTTFVDSDEDRRTAAMKITLAGSSGIGDVVLCELVTPTPTPTPSATPTATPTAEATPTATPTAEPTPEILCEDVDISETQFSLDGGSVEQEQLVRRSLRQLKRIDRSRSARRFTANTKDMASTLAVANWELTYSIPSVQTQCSGNLESCVTVSNVSALTSYVANSEELRDLALEVIRRTKKARRKAGLKKQTRKLQNLTTKIEQQHETNLANTQLVPELSIDCF